LSAQRGQYVYDTTNSALFINFNNDNFLTTTDYRININPASTASASIVDGDVNFVITGGTNADVIIAGGGADTINGGAGADNISGGVGADVISSGTGTDSILGGTGSDIFAFAAGDSDQITIAVNGSSTGTDFINDFAAGDLIRITVTSADTTWDMAHVLVGTAGGTQTAGAVTSYTAISYLVQAGVPATAADAYDIAINVTTNGTAAANGTTAAFANAAAAQAVTVVNLTGTAGADSLTTGDNNDTITGGDGVDAITGGLGSDTIILTEGVAAQDTVVTTIGVAQTTALADVVTGFTAGVGGDILQIDISDTTAIANLGIVAAGDGATAIAGDLVIVGHTLGTALTLAATDEIVVVSGTAINAAALLTSIGGAAGITKSAANTTTNGLLIVWYDGANTHVSAVSDVGADAAMTTADLALTDIAILTGQVTGFNTINFTAVA
jgi:hypothetical protein